MRIKWQILICMFFIVNKLLANASPILFSVDVSTKSNIGRICVVEVDVNNDLKISSSFVIENVYLIIKDNNDCIIHEQLLNLSSTEQTIALPVEYDSDEYTIELIYENKTYRGTISAVE